MTNKLQALHSAEIKEIATMEDVQQTWGAESAGEMAQRLETDICAVKFPRYVTDGPGYAGELYFRMGGDLSAPLMLIRKDGKLLINDPE